MKNIFLLILFSMISSNVFSSIEMNNRSIAKILTKYNTSPTGGTFMVEEANFLAECHVNSMALPSGGKCTIIGEDETLYFSMSDFFKIERTALMGKLGSLIEIFLSEAVTYCRIGHSILNTGYNCSIE